MDATPRSTTHPLWASAEPTHDLIVDGRAVAGAWEARARREIGKGLLGTSDLRTPEGEPAAVLLNAAGSVHSMGMRYALDIAFLRSDGTAVATHLLPRRRMTRFHLRASHVLEAPAGSFEGWGLTADSVVTLRPR